MNIKSISVKKINAPNLSPITGNPYKVELDGVDISTNVRSISIYMGVDKVNVVKIEFIKVELDIDTVQFTEEEK